MNYGQLSPEDFDAIVTGELTHYAIWMESELVGIISDYFVAKKKRSDFERYILRRDGLTFQDKIEIVRAMLSLFSNKEVATRLKSALTRVEGFKATRNAFAHGVDVTPKGLSQPAIHVEIVTRSGKEKVVVVTPKHHEVMLSNAEALLKELQTYRSKLNV